LSSRYLPLQTIVKKYCCTIAEGAMLRKTLNAGGLSRPTQRRHMDANQKVLVAVGQIVRSAMLQEPDGEAARAAFDALVMALAEGKEFTKLTDAQIRVLRGMTRAREDRLPRPVATAVGLDKATYGDALLLARMAAKHQDEELEAMLEIAEEGQRQATSPVAA
jgi:hypothetical protein